MSGFEFPLTDSELVDLGKLHCCSGYIENLLQLIILRAYGLDVDKGRLLIQRMDLPQKVEIVSELASCGRLVSNSNWDSQKICSRIRAFATSRNRVAHSAWARRIGSNDVRAVSLKQWGNFNQSIQPSELSGLVDEAQNLLNELSNILDALVNGSSAK
ncbi:MAG: hypothetical protein EAZ37_01730 [Burkholderiales bacterium]|nr:MAG: hypothetical protein EAZ37_01730 [Burkholderiales bacterium]